MSVYRTRDGDVLDAICYERYGRQDMVESVLGANPGLAARGAVLPSGVEILLPNAAPRPDATPIRLWGRG